MPCPPIPGLLVYVPPAPRRRYVVGADTAEGGPQSNDSAFSLLDRETGEECCSLAGRIEPSVFGRYIGQAATWYNNASVMVERISRPLDRCRGRKMVAGCGAVNATPCPTQPPLREAVMSDESFTIFGVFKESRSAFARRFWSKVRMGDGCWEWQATRNGNGYGKFAVSRCNMHNAHRVAWVLAYGDIPPGLCVLHNCPGGDNPLCVNPAHLWLGTKRDNTQDMLAKGRDCHGEASPKARIPEAVIAEARRLRSEDGLSYRRIGLALGMSAEHAWKIVKGKRRRRV